MGRATEETAHYTGPRVGGFLNATLGNAAELIITIIALREGLTEVVKASIAGSIIGNILIVLGLSVLLGGLKNGTQRFDAQTAGVNATMMALAVVALCIPAVISYGDSHIRPSDHDIEHLSDGMAFVMIGLYVLYLIFTLRGGTPNASGVDSSQHASMSLRAAIAVLAGSTIAIVLMSEILVGALEPTAQSWGLVNFSSASCWYP